MVITGVLASNIPAFASDGKDRLPECNSIIVRTTAADAVVDAYFRLGMGAAPIASNFAAHIRRTLHAYMGNDRETAERSAAHSVGLTLQDVRFCVTDEIANMQIMVWVASNQKNKNQWHAVVTNFGMGGETVAASPPLPK